MSWRHVRLVSWSLTAAALLFVTLEAVLWGLGIGGGRTGADMEREAVYLVPSLQTEGGWSTRFASKRFKEVEVPPKGVANRVVVFGSSTAHRFGATPLARELNHRRSGTLPFEVYNLGVQGYGSWRVSAIFEQALEHLGPDVVILYFGDNEFAEVLPEDRTGLDQDAASSAVRLISSTRTFSALRQLMRPGDAIDERRPAKYVVLEAAGTKLTFGDTLEREQQLRENLLRMCERAREEGPKVVLCTLAYNRLSPPRGWLPGKDIPEEVRTEIGDLLEEARTAMPRFLVTLFREAKRINSSDWRGAGAPSKVPDIPIWQPECLGSLRAQPAFHGTEPWQWSEKLWNLLSALGRFYERDAAAEERAGLLRTEGLLRAVLELCPDHPVAHFQLGLVRYQLDDDPSEAIEHFELAASFDRAPRKSSKRINDLIREVAREFPEVLLYDADAYVSSLVPGGLVGWECMLDDCHPGPGSYAVLRVDLVRAINERWN